MSLVTICRDKPMLNVVQTFKNDSGKARALEAIAHWGKSLSGLYPGFLTSPGKMCKKAKGTLAFSQEQKSG